MTALVSYDHYQFKREEVIGDGLESKVTGHKFLGGFDFELEGVTQKEVDDAIAVHYLESAKQRKIEEIRRWSDEVDLGGFEWNGHTWDSDDKAQRRIPSAVISGMDVPYWMNKDNQPVPMTAQDMKDLHQAMIDHVMSFHGRKQQMKAEVEALTTADEVNAYVVGWD